MRILFGLIIVVGLTLATSFSMSRYQADLDAKIAKYTDLVKQIPEKFGDWVRVRTEKVPDYAAIELKIKDSEYWLYENTKTKARVNVSILVGPTGRLGVHTPEICLAGDNLVPREDRVAATFKTLLPGGQEVNNEFWRVAFNEVNQPGIKRLFYYAMGTGNVWYAANDPRYDFAKYPFMLKMQAESVMLDSEKEGEDVVHEFLTAFLPEVANVFSGTNLD
ncbi:MAG: EpsI family protein [Planctomycetaceae bacterium]|nr:EpsI family protein [Planctomycetaceae bacterium]